MPVRIVTYNLLVPIYAEQPENYIYCQSEFLQTEYRWNLIEKQFEKEMTDHENTIICVQELSLRMLPLMQLFCRRMNYTLFENLYGGSWNDYMGVGIAIPNTMKLTNVVYIKVGDYIRSICGPTENVMNDPWETSMSRLNTLVCAEVIVEDKPLWIGTYHMPCYYQEPSVMAIHSSIVKDQMFKIAAGNDFILTGDFNLEPKDTAYRALIEKDYRDTNYQSSEKYNVSYSIMKSAYLERNGREPNFTTCCHTNGSSWYCDTLDYIFYSGELVVDDVLQLPENTNADSYPDETHPSDHLMLAATFSFSK